MNLKGAVQLAKLVRQDLTNETLLETPLLTSANAPIPSSAISGFTFN